MHKLTYKRYSIRLKILLLFIINTTLLLAQQSSNTVTLRGHAKDYAGHHLIIENIINPISLESGSLATIYINDNGDFEQNIKTSRITYASIDMGRFKGYIYLEPGKTYDIVLPPFEPRTDADRFNPYFVPENVIIGITNEEAQHLNKSISEFDSDLNYKYNKNAVAIFSRGDKKKVETIIHELDSLHPSEANTYLDLYKQYDYAELLMLGYKRNIRTVIKRTMGTDKLMMHMPSFRKSFKIIFKNFFTYYFRSSHGKELKNAYTKGTSYDSLAMIIKQDELFKNEELAELVLLKSLYDAFYSGHYEQEQIISLFKQAKEKGCTQDIKDIAGGLYKKTTWLRTGSKAPEFTLYRLDGKERYLSDYKGKFVYLNFMHTSNHTCKQDLQLLNIISKQLKRELTIVTVILDEDPKAAQEMVKKNKYKWDFLHYTAQPKVALDYNIKALPTYFIINPEQKLSLSPAPSPNESFVPIFLETSRNYKHEQLRKDRPKPKSIYDF